MNKQGIILAAITLATLSAVIAISLAVSSSPDRSPDYTPVVHRGGNDSGLWTTTDLRAAEEFFGQPIAQPAFIPDGFARSDIISIAEHLTSRDWKTVDQSWADPAQQASFLLSQDSLLAGRIAGNEPFTIAGYEAERRLLPADIHRPPLLTFLWHDDRYSYKLTGFLNGSLTEDLLLQIAESVSVH